MKINSAKSFCKFKYTCTHVIYIYSEYTMYVIYMNWLIIILLHTCHMPMGTILSYKKMYINASEI